MQATTLPTPRTDSPTQNWLSNLLHIQSGRSDVERATANDSRHGYRCSRATTNRRMDSRKVFAISVDTALGHAPDGENCVA